MKIVEKIKRALKWLDTEAWEKFEGWFIEKVWNWLPVVSTRQFLKYAVCVLVCIAYVAVTVLCWLFKHLHRFLDWLAGLMLAFMSAVGGEKD